MKLSYLIVPLTLLVLSACASPERQALTQACAGGNLDACYAAESLDQQRRERMLVAGQSLMADPAPPAPMTGGVTFITGLPTGPMTVIE